MNFWSSWQAMKKRSVHLCSQSYWWWHGLCKHLCILFLLVVMEPLPHQQPTTPYIRMYVCTTIDAVVISLTDSPILYIAHTDACTCIPLWNLLTHYIRMYVHTYVRTCVCTYMRMYCASGIVFVSYYFLALFLSITGACMCLRLSFWCSESK